MGYRTEMSVSMEVPSHLPLSLLKGSASPTEELSQRDHRKLNILRYGGPPRCGG